MENNFRIMENIDVIQFNQTSFYTCDINLCVRRTLLKFMYEGWNFNSGNYLITTDTK